MKLTERILNYGMIVCYILIGIVIGIVAMNIDMKQESKIEISDI